MIAMSTCADATATAGAQGASPDGPDTLDPVISRPTWTAVVFHHEGLGAAMRALFEERWLRGTDLYSRYPNWASYRPNVQFDMHIRVRL